MTERHIELLLGRSVLAPDGRPIGRLEEVRVEPDGDEMVVTEYHVGGYAVLERFAAWTIGRAALGLFGAAHPQGGYRVPWDKLDLSDPHEPRLTCPPEDLQTLR
jgi:hypothetical protein